MQSVLNLFLIFSISHYKNQTFELITEYSRPQPENVQELSKIMPCANRPPLHLGRPSGDSACAHAFLSLPVMPLPFKPLNLHLKLNH